MSIKLRKWVLEDAENLAKALNNITVQDNLRDGIPYPYTIEDAKEYIISTLNTPVGKSYSWAVTKNDKAIGSLGIFRQDNIHNRTAELGYYIAEPYWGMGYMTLAVKEACKIIFDTTDIIRIFAEPFSQNIASCKVLEKAGFVCEGVLRQNGFKNDEVFDMKMYSIIKAI